MVQIYTMFLIYTIYFKLFFILLGFPNGSNTFKGSVFSLILAKKRGLDGSIKFNYLCKTMKILLIIFLFLVIIALVVYICRITKEVRKLEADNRRLKIDLIKLQMKLLQK